MIKNLSCEIGALPPCRIMLRLSIRKCGNSPSEPQICANWGVLTHGNPACTVIYLEMVSLRPPAKQTHEVA